MYAPIIQKERNIDSPTYFEGGQENTVLGGKQHWHCDRLCPDTYWRQTAGQGTMQNDLNNNTNNNLRYRLNMSHVCLVLLLYLRHRVIAEPPE